MSSHYIQLTKNNFKKSSGFLLKSFGIVEGTGLLTRNQKIENIRDIVHECVDSGMSHAFVDDNGDILAQVLNANLYEFEQVLNDHMDPESSIDNFVKKADNMCFTKNPMDVLYTYNISSGHFYNKNKYARYLVEKSIEDARLCGFESIVTDCTDREYQHVFHNAGFQDKLRCDKLPNRGLLNGNIITNILHMEKKLITRLLV